MARKKWSRPDDTDLLGPPRADEAGPAAPPAESPTAPADEIDLASVPMTAEAESPGVGAFDFEFAQHPAVADDRPAASAEIPIPPLPPPTAAVVPPAAPASSPVIDLMDERMKRLEDTLARLAQIQNAEQRIVEHLADRIQSTPSSPAVPVPQTPPPSSPSINPVAVLGAAQTLMDAGRSMLPSLAPSGPMITAGPRPVNNPRRPWSLGELLAEWQGMYYMYADPRYKLSWAGRIAAPVLAAAFATSSFWLPYFGCGLGAIPILSKPIELVLAYALIRVLTSESRRYRETAPELPASLRL